MRASIPLNGMLIALLAVTGIGAVAGGTGIIAQGPDLLGGDILADTWLADRYTLVGMLLVVTVGVPHLVAALALLKRLPPGAALALVAGALLLIWLVVQVATIVERSWLQPIYAGVGILESVLAWLLTRQKQAQAPR